MDPSYNNSFGSQAPIASGPISSGTISSGSAGPAGTPAGAFGSTPLSSGTGDIILGSGKQTKSKKPILIAAIGVVVMLAIVLIVLAVLNLNKEDKNNNRAAINSYIEYFVYGTEGENIVDDTIFEIPTDEYAANYIDDEYGEKLIKKFNVIKINNSDTKKYLTELLKFYIIATATIDGRNNNELNIENNSAISAQYLVLNHYIDNKDDSNHKLLRRELNIAYDALSRYLNTLYYGSVK